MSIVSLFPFGLDISDRSIKLAQLEKEGRFFRLANFGKISLEPGMIENGLILNVDGVAEALHRLISGTSNLKKKKIIAALPEEHTYARILNIPKSETVPLGSVIMKAAQANIPLPIEEIYFDYEIAEEKEDNLQALLVATPKNLVDAYLRLFRKAELKPMALETEVFSLIRSLVPNFSSRDTLLLVDFGATRSTFVIFQGKFPFFTVTVPISGEQLNKSIAQNLDVNKEEAERLKIEVGFDRDKEGGKVATALEPVLTRLKNEIQKYIEFYETHSGKEGVDKMISRVVLTGGDANLVGLIKFLELQLQMEVRIGNPWTNILKPPLKEVPELSFYDSTSYAVALGAALRGAIE